MESFTKKVKALENKRTTEISKKHLRVLNNADEDGIGECSEMLFQENPLNDLRLRKLVGFCHRRSLNQPN